LLLAMHLSSASAQGARVDERLQFIEQHFAQQNTAANVWQWGWLGVHAVSVAGGGALLYYDWDDKADRAAWMGLAGKSLVSLGFSALLPLRSASGLGALQDMPADSEEARLQKLHVAETLLKEAAHDQEGKAAWLPHILNIVVNGAVAAGTYAYLNAQDRNTEAYDRRWSAPLVGMALGIVTTEIKIFTTPQSSRSAWERYQRVFEMDADERVLRRQEQQTMHWYVMPQLSGASLLATF